jgi:histone H3
MNFVLIIVLNAVANLCAIHAKRVTIQHKDMRLVRHLCKIMTGHSMPGRGVIPPGLGGYGA